MTSIIFNKKIISMYLKAYTQNFVKNCPVVSEKSKFYFSYVNDLRLRVRNDLNIYSISCLHLQTFRLQATIVSEKSTLSHFPIQKPILQNLTLP